jgi:hypothetical protein
MPTPRDENISFNHKGRTYTAYGWWDEAQEGYHVTGVLVLYHQRSRHGGTNRRSRYVYRGLESRTKFQCTLILIAASMLYDRRLARIEEAA